MFLVALQKLVIELSGLGIMSLEEECKSKPNLIIAANPFSVH